MTESIKIPGTLIDVSYLGPSSVTTIQHVRSQLYSHYSLYRQQQQQQQHQQQQQQQQQQRQQQPIKLSQIHGNSRPLSVEVVSRIRQYASRNDSFVDLKKIYYNRSNELITKQFLINHGITVGVLVSECRVDMTDMKLAGILCLFDDLVDIGFSMSDLKIDTSLLNTGKLASLFDIKFRDLMKHPKVEASIVDIINHKFSSVELMILDFDFGDLITPQYCPPFKLVQMMGYCLDQLIEVLGLKGEHVKRMKFTLENLFQLGRLRKDTLSSLELTQIETLLSMGLDNEYLGVLGLDLEDLLSMGIRRGHLKPLGISNQYAAERGWDLTRIPHRKREPPDTYNKQGI